MAKVLKKKIKQKKQRGNYDEKLSVNGSFIDIMSAAVKDANNKSIKKV